MSKTKISLILMLGGTVTFFLGFGVYSSMDTLSGFEVATAVFVILITIGGILIARSRLKDEKKGLPAEDEMSKKIREKAGAASFLVSFYIWTFMIIFFSGSQLDREVIIGIGVVATAVVFMGFWVYYYRTGVGFENQN